MRFPPGDRLRRPGEFSRVLRQGRRLSEGRLQLCYHAPADQGRGARLGLAIAKRVQPRAVDRNRIKRLVRESFRRQRSTLPALDIVILVRGARARGVPPGLETHLSRLWQRLQTSSDRC